MSIKIITLFIAGAVFTAGLIMGFGDYAFADKNYSSSLSNTKSIGQVRTEVGDVLLRYGVGGADINKVTDVLERGGVYEAELKSLLLTIGINEKDTQDILLEFDKIGISEDGAQGVSAPDAGDTVPSAGDPIDGIDIALDEIPAGRIFHTPDDNNVPQKLINVFREAAVNLTEKMKVAESKEQHEGIRKELQANRQVFSESVRSLHQDLRANAKTLRDNFRENVRATIGHVDHGKTARIALAHGKGLRMINRYRSAIARFDHILGRLESRIEKIGIEIEAQARSKHGKVKDIFPPDNLATPIEEAKNTQTLNKAKLAELEAKYESLLFGEHPKSITHGKGLAKDAFAIAKELKTEIEKLHGLLDDIKQAAVDYNSSRSNVKL